MDLLAEAGQSRQRGGQVGRRLRRGIQTHDRPASALSSASSSGTIALTAFGDELHQPRDLECFLGRPQPTRTIVILDQADVVERRTVSLVQRDVHAVLCVVRDGLAGPKTVICSRQQRHEVVQIANGTQGLAETLEDADDGGREATDEVLQWITDEMDYSGYMIQPSLSALWIFAAFHLDEITLSDIDDDDVDLDDKLPERFAKIEPSSHVEHDPVPNPGNVVQYREMTEMVDHEKWVRDQAIVATQWGAGLRPMAELWPLQRKHLKDEADHYLITVPENTKTGSRPVKLVVGYPLLKQWIE